MNNRGQTDMGIGMIIVVAMTLIIGAVFLVPIAQLAGDVTNTATITNQSLDCTTNGTTLANIQQLTGKFATITNVFNGTSGTLIGSGNYTLYNNQVINGVETAGINCSVESATGSWQTQAWNISYVSQPTTYASDGGSRAVTGLIAIFFALAVLVAALTPTIRSGVMDLMNK